MNAFFASAATKQVTKADSRVTLAVQLIAPSLRPGYKKDRSIIDGLFTMWAAVVIGDTTESQTILDGEKIRLKMWSDSITVKVPEGLDITSFEEALVNKLFFAEITGFVEEQVYHQVDKRDGAISDHKQLKVVAMKLSATKPVIEEETGDEADSTPF